MYKSDKSDSSVIRSKISLVLPPTTHSFACSALVPSLTGSAEHIYLLAYSIAPELIR